MESSSLTSMEARVAALETTLGIDLVAPTYDDDDDAPNPRQQCQQQQQQDHHHHQQQQQQQQQTVDVTSRINLLLDDLQRRLEPSSAIHGGKTGGRLDPFELHQLEELSASLDAGSVLSHQGSVAVASAVGRPDQQPLTAPLLYRRQEVLANADRLGVGMKRLQRIHCLLDSVSVRKGAAAGGSVIGGSGGVVLTGKESSRKSADQFASSALLTSEGYQYVTDPAVTRRLHDVSLQVADINARAASVASRVDALVSNYHRIMTALSEKCVLADEELRMVEKRKPQR